jgi:hypothetical protein
MKNKDNAISKCFGRTIIYSLGILWWHESFCWEGGFVISANNIDFFDANNLGSAYSNDFFGSYQ